MASSTSGKRVVFRMAKLIRPYSRMTTYIIMIRVSICAENSREGAAPTAAGRRMRERVEVRDAALGRLNRKGLRKDARARAQRATSAFRGKLAKANSRFFTARNAFKSLFTMMVTHKGLTLQA